MNPVVKKTLNIALDVVVAILVIFAVLISMVAISSNANNNVPNVFGYSPFSVQTGSMEPTISEGDYIFVEKCDTAALQKGDIIAFFSLEQGQKIIKTHRIEAVVTAEGSVMYQTKGDHNPTTDDVLVSQNDVIGKYTGFAIPLMGDVMDFLSSKWGFFCVILLPILLFTIYQIYRLISTVMHNKKVDMANDVADLASEDVKEAIIAQYLAQQAEEQEDQPTSESTRTDETSE